MRLTKWMARRGIQSGVLREVKAGHGQVEQQFAANMHLFIRCPAPEKWHFMVSLHDDRKVTEDITQSRK